MSDFEVFRASAKVFMGFFLIFFTAYVLAVFLELFKSKGGQEEVPLVPGLLVTYRKVWERDMSVPFLFFFVFIAVGGFHVFQTIMGIFLLAASALMTLGHFRNNKTSVLIGKITSVVTTSAGFVACLSQDLYFD